MRRLFPIRAIRAIVLAVCIGLVALGTGPTSTVAVVQAQAEREPPAPGGAVYEEPLTKPGVFTTGACPSGNGGSEIVGDGVMLKAQGRCLETQQIVAVGPFLNGVTILDGELRIDFKVVSGIERAAVNVGLRFQNGDAPGGYVFTVVPGAGRAAIVKFRPGEHPVALAERAGLGGAFRRDDWNTLSLRVLGPSLWLLVNDRPALAVEDGAYDVGGVPLNIERLGNPDDDAEIAVVFRNLRVSSLAGAPAERTPSAPRAEILAQMPSAR